MKAHVYVVSKRTVLDPQGQAIHNALKKLGHTGVSDIRQGKYFILNLDDSLGSKAPRSNASPSRF
jgi:phosphoribosylformylglycinamidine synthase PurS subunit